MITQRCKHSKIVGGECFSYNYKISAQHTFLFFSHALARKVFQKKNKQTNKQKGKVEPSRDAKTVGIGLF